MLWGGQPRHKGRTENSTAFIKKRSSQQHALLSSFPARLISGHNLNFHHSQRRRLRIVQFACQEAG